MENSERRFQVLSKTAIMVNLDAPPKLPFATASVEKNIGGGLVKVEKCEDGLYVDGHKVILHLSKQQKSGRMSGHKLREELSGKPVLHPNILDALLEHPDLIPEDWKKGDICIYFWAVIFRGFYGSLLVRCLYFDSGKWCRSYYLLDDGWIGRDPAALLAS